MYKKATFVLAGIGALLLVGNSASAKITEYESYVTIQSSTKEDYTVKFYATTLNDNPQAKLSTESTLYKGDEHVDDAAGTVRASSTYTDVHGHKIRYKIETDHFETLGRKQTDAEYSEDTVAYNPTDWTFVKLSDEEAKKEAQAYDNLLTQRATEIAADTGVDLDGYAPINKGEVFDIDPDLYQEVRALTKTEVGDKKPQIHLHESGKSLYILRQYADGTNTAVEFVLENGKWDKQ